MADGPAPVASRRGGATPAIPGLLIPVLPLVDLGDGSCPHLVLHVDLVGQLAEDVVNVVIQDHPVASSSTGFSGPGRSRPVSALARERGCRGRARNPPDLGADRLVHVAGIAVGSGLLLEVQTGGSTGGPVPEGVLRFRAGRQAVVKFANHLVQQVEAGPDIVTETNQTK